MLGGVAALGLILSLLLLWWYLHDRKQDSKARDANMLESDENLAAEGAVPRSDLEKAVGATATARKASM